MSIETVIARPGYYVWARGGVRAEVRRTTGSLRWRWRVWRVLGPRDLAGALAPTLVAARSEALQVMEKVAAP